MAIQARNFVAFGSKIASKRVATFCYASLPLFTTTLTEVQGCKLNSHPQAIVSSPFRPIDRVILLSTVTHPRSPDTGDWSTATPVTSCTSTRGAFIHICSYTGFHHINRTSEKKTTASYTSVTQAPIPPPICSHTVHSPSFLTCVLPHPSRLVF